MPKNIRSLRDVRTPICLAGAAAGALLLAACGQAVGGDAGGTLTGEQWAWGAALVVLLGGALTLASLIGTPATAPAASSADECPTGGTHQWKALSGYPPGWRCLLCHTHRSSTTPAVSR